MRRFSKLKRFKNTESGVSHIPVDVFLRFKDFLCCPFYYARAMISFFGGAKEVAQTGGEMSRYLPAFVSFYSYFSCVSIKYSLVAVNILNEKSSGDIYFSYAHTWQQNCMNEIFRAKGVKTITSTHGIIQEPNLMTSCVDVCYVDNLKDRTVLCDFSSDRAVEYRASIKNLDPPRSEKPFVFSKILVLGKLFYSDAPASPTDRFFEVLAETLDHRGEDVSVYYRPHPREPSSMKQSLEQVIGKDVSVDQGAFDDVVDRYDLIISPFSTAVIDLVRLGGRVIVYKSCYDSSETLASEVDAEYAFYDMHSLDVLVSKLIENGYSDGVLRKSLLQYF